MRKKAGIMLAALWLFCDVVALVCFTPSADAKSDKAENQSIYAENDKSKEDQVNNTNETEGEKKVLQFDKEVVLKVMLEDGWSDWAYVQVNSMSKYDARLQPVLDAYLADRSISADFNVEGVTIPLLMEKMHVDFWNALSRIDIYLHNPELAKEFMEMKYHDW